MREYFCALTFFLLFVSSKQHSSDLVSTSHDQTEPINCCKSDVAFAERRPDINSDFAGIYPWDWVGDDIASFKALQGGLLVAPILQQLILNREPIEVLDFADEVAKWPIERIIPAHLKNNLKYEITVVTHIFWFSLLFFHQNF